MNAQREPDASWIPCREGEVAGLVRRLKWRKRTPLLAGVAGASMAILIAVTVFLLASRGGPEHQGEYHFAGISCSDVRAQARQYMMGQLAPELRRRIDDHLEECPECGALFRQMQMMEDPHAMQDLSLGSSIGSTFFGPLETCPCPDCTLVGWKGDSHMLRRRADLPRVLAAVR